MVLYFDNIVLFYTDFYETSNHSRRDMGSIEFSQKMNKNVKGIASTAPIIAKGIIPQPHYVEIFYIKFYPSPSKNVDIVCRNCFTHVSKA
jgi:hypothetical protein